MAHSHTKKVPRLGKLGICLALLAAPVTSTPLAADGSGERDAEIRALAAEHVAIAGRVVGKAEPLASVSVFAYDVLTRVVRTVVTDRKGNFLFSALPRSMYQIVAIKQGFAPAVEPLLPNGDEIRKFVELQLREETTGDVREAEDYWSVRSRIPPDVFRELSNLALRNEGERAPSTWVDGGFGGEMKAHGGVENLGRALGDAQLTTAEVDLQGAIGEHRVELAGSYQQLAQTGDTQIPDGQVSALALEINNAGQDSALRLTTAASEMASIRRGEIQPVDMEHFQLDWHTRAGGNGRSGVRAQYTEELGFHQPAWVRMAEIPDASRLLKVEGFYEGQLSETTSLKAGASYRQLDGQITSLPDFAQASRMFTPADLAQAGAALAGDGSILGYGASLTDETLGLYGLAGSQIRPRVLVEYGLFSTVRGDGSISLMPRGGMVVQLGDSNWKAKTSISHRLEEDREADAFAGFRSAFYSDQTSCQRAGEACYEVTFTRGKNPDDEISVGAVHRKFAETLRIYFSPDFFDRLESVFVTEGDSVPELQFRMVRRISPRVLAKLESNFAAGGGGIFYATHESMPYENEVRYLVTSLDTRFQQTSTGVFIAFHHLEQALNPIDSQGNPAVPEIEVQRLQLMLTQDLNVLANVASNWAVRFNVELSRGATPYTLSNDDEITKKLTGGLSVSF